MIIGPHVVVRVKAWIISQHPHVVQFLATFFGVLMAALFTWFIKEIEASHKINNLLNVMYLDCYNAKLDADDLRLSIRDHLGITDYQYNVWEEIVSLLGMQDEDAKVVDVVNDSGGRSLLSDFERLVYNVTPLPEVMISALESNSQLYSGMTQLNYTRILEYSPGIKNAHFGYATLVRDAEILLSRFENEQSVLIELANYLPADRSKHFNYLVKQKEIAFEYEMSSIIGEAIRSLDRYHDNLFFVCHHLESEWRVRKCGLSESDLEKIYEEDEMTFSGHLTCN